MLCVFTRDEGIWYRMLYGFTLMNKTLTYLHKPKYSTFEHTWVCTYNVHICVFQPVYAR